MRGLILFVLLCWYTVNGKVYNADYKPAMPLKLNLTEEQFAKLKKDFDRDIEENLIMDTYLKGLKTRNITDVRVMGGTDAVLSEALYFCQIFNFNKYGSYTFCGGAAIAERFIVSSSHCFNKKDSLQKIKVRIGSTKLGKGGHIGIKKIITHNSEDLALLLTEDEIESGNRIGLSSIAERLGEMGTFFGFGINGFLNSVQLPTTLQKTTIVVKGAIGHWPNLFATSGNIKGDSGGAVIWKEYRKSVIGGIYCVHVQKNNTCIFLRAKDFKMWINDQMAMAL
ncbi:unnamed protein product [Meloidogyne enterolobii]|uniref:Uncharacterized protein n=1 Tax=Meloidogyne enterolobii TaxID=390850 RepID=A0ACB0YKR5_MELEN